METKTQYILSQEEYMALKKESEMVVNELNVLEVIKYLSLLPGVGPIKAGTIANYFVKDGISLSRKEPKNIPRIYGNT